MQGIIPHLWFDDEAQEAAEFYTGLFERSKITEISRYPEAGQAVHGRAAGSVMTVAFELEGVKFLALNGGPGFAFNPSISFSVSARSADEVDRLWAALSEGGEALMPLGAYPFSRRFGWLNDRYGLSWQLVLFETPRAQKIFPSLMFTGPAAGQAEAAVRHYAEVFTPSQVGEVYRYGEGEAPNVAGEVAHLEFGLLGLAMSAMDSRIEHGFTFNEAVSLLVTCRTQAEIDGYWAKLSAHPEAEQCGWLKDAFGLSWQIVPAGMDEAMRGDPERVKRAFDALMGMKKIDIAALERAYEGAGRS